MNFDFFFTMWNCSECAFIKDKINKEAIFNDDFVGKNNQSLVVINTYSNTAASSLLKQFEFPDNAITPALLTFEGEMFWNVEEILNHFEKQGFLNA